MHTKNLDNIGIVKFKKSNFAKNISISVRPIHGVKVSFPYYISYSDAEQIVNQKRDWILRQLNKAKEVEKRRTIFNENGSYQTRFHTLALFKHEKNIFSVRVQNGMIKVYYPSCADINSENVQSAIRTGIERALRKEANEYLPDRAKELAEKFGFEYKKLALKNIRTRWGSCSKRKNINLNIHLMRLPDQLIDYVILHELAHTVEMNHSKNFWKLLDKLTGGAKQLNKELKKHHISFY